MAYLLLKGELPNADQLAAWEHTVNTHRFVHENVGNFIRSYRHDAHPMAKMMAAVASMQTFYPSSRRLDDPEAREMNIVRLIAKIPTMAAWSYRHSIGRHYVYPNDELGYVDNFLAMLFQSQQRVYRADPRVSRAMEILFILHADHEQNCSTNAVRAVASAGNDVYTSAGAGIGALFGPLHGGANEAVLKMLREIGSVDRVPEFVEGVKNGKARLMGFGHRVYKNYDPRARIIKKACDDVFEVTGVNPLLEIAVELERIALEDEYFVKRRLYPNVDFYSGLIYEALKLPAGDVHRAVRGAPHGRVGCPVARGCHRPGAEDHAPQAGLHRPPRARLRPGRGALTQRRQAATRAAQRSRTPPRRPRPR